jgi:hypothetical protein
MTAAKTAGEALWLFAPNDDWPWHSLSDFEKGRAEKRAQAFIAWHEAQRTASAEPLTVEVWKGDRKVTIYPGDIVLRIWGVDVENEMSEEPHTLKSAQDAIDWLYEPQPSAEPVLSDDARDAARYRWLREHDTVATYYARIAIESALLPAGESFATMDKAIDAAIKERT